MDILQKNEILTTLQTQMICDISVVNHVNSSEIRTRVSKEYVKYEVDKDDRRDKVAETSKRR